MIRDRQTSATAAMLEPVLSARQAGAYNLAVLAWFGALLFFWFWWLQPAHIASGPGFAATTAVLAWITLTPAYFILLFRRARRVRADAPLPAGRVAMVVTKAPSEPFGVVEKTLRAMLDQTDVVYDVWLADEDPDAQTRAWCRQHGVSISTRKGIAAYHQPCWPRRTRCKEGNLAYFYDHYGYDRYDFVAQFDADHVPDQTYLREILKPFADPHVGYVSAPSICDANARESWAARGRLYAEASLHGALQVGYNSGWAPLCIGSHYAVRTKALREIGGLGPELAEDHSTTLLMNAHGWRGIHAIDAIAHGDGPATFADLITQEFQWSRSLTTVLLQYTPGLLGRLPNRLKFQFLFAQLWYPLFSLGMALMFALPLIALVTGSAPATVTYPDFLLHFLPLSLGLIGLAIFWRSTGTYRPHDAKLFGWESMAFILLRWPWSLAGCLVAVGDRLRRSFVDFRITPKGQQAAPLLPARVVLPYGALACLCAAAMMTAQHNDGTEGFSIFAAINIAVYAGGLLVIVVGHGRENGWRTVLSPATLSVSTVGLALAIGFGGEGLQRHGLAGVDALVHGQSIFTVTETRFTVAGGGFPGDGRTRTFKPRWLGPTWQLFTDDTDRAAAEAGSAMATNRNL